MNIQQKATEYLNRIDAAKAELVSVQDYIKTPEGRTDTLANLRVSELNHLLDKTQLQLNFLLKSQWLLRTKEVFVDGQYIDGYVPPSEEDTYQRALDIFGVNE